MPLWGSTSELRSTGPNLVPLLATRYLYWGYVWLGVSLTQRLTQMSSWPDVVLLVATRCLYWVDLTKGQPDPKADQMSSWPYVILLLALDASTGGTSELRLTRPNLVPLLAARCLYQGVHLTEGQPDPKADQISSWPDIVLLSAARCLYWGVHLTKGHPDPKADQMSSWPYVILLLALDASTGGTSELRLTRPNLVPLLAARCLYQGVHLTEGQPDPKADQISSWPDIVLLSAARCLYWGVHLTKGHPDPKADQMSSWPYVVLLLALDASTGGTSELRSTRPNLVPLLAARCLYQGGTSDWRSAWPKGWPNIKLPWCSTTLGH